MKQYFIIGTDTDCGKTYTTCVMLRENPELSAIKPIASGGTSDIDAIIQATYEPHLPIHQYLFAPPIAPHIAAHWNNQTITFDALDRFIDQYVTDMQSNSTEKKALFIETTGGLMCPLNHQDTWCDYIAYKKLPVIFIVGLKLGCINHALMTQHVLNQHDIKCSGWIANILDPNMPALEDNIQTLKYMLEFTHLKTIGYESLKGNPGLGPIFASMPGCILESTSDG